MSLLIYKKCVRSCTIYTIPRICFPRALLTMECYLMARTKIIFTSMWTILTGDITFQWFIFHLYREINRGWVRAYLGMCTIYVNYRVITMFLPWEWYFALPFAQSWRILDTADFDNMFLYKYTLIDIIYIGEPLDNLNFKLSWNIYIHIHAWILLYLPKEKSEQSFPCQC